MRRSVSRLGHAFLKFGCLGSLTITPLLYYLSRSGSPSKTGEKPVLTILLNLFATLVAFFIASWLFRQKRRDH